MKNCDGCFGASFNDCGICQDFSTEPKISLEEAVEILTDKIQDGLSVDLWTDYENAIDRILYELKGRLDNDRK